MEISSEGMELRKYDSLLDAVSDTGVSRQTLAYAHKNKRRKGGAEVFYIKWIEDCQAP